MSRSTQYIGINKFAEDYVTQASKVETYEMTTGMFDEPVLGSIYYMPPPPGPNKALIAKEVVQVEPWSSGPMIFTHLQLTLVKECGQEINMGIAFSWMLDPSMAGSEFDSDT